MNLEHKIDFKVVISVKDANPNGDPLNGNRPRQTMEGYGEISDVAIKRKLRNALQDQGQKIFVQSDDRATDGFKSLKERAGAIDGLKEAQEKKDTAAYARIACQEWFDVRAFGSVFAFKKGGAGNGLSVGVRGPVSIQMAKSITPIEINEMQITKSVNSEPGEKKSSDTMGMKFTVDYGVYVFNGSISPQLAEKTGFSAEDAEALHQALIHMFDNDSSAARPAGSMEVLKVYWWEHNSKAGQHSPAQMHRSIKVLSKTGDQVMRSVADVEFDESHKYDDVDVEIYSGL